MKHQDPSFHPGPWGGVKYRGLKFGEEVDELIQALVWRNVQLHPSHNLQDHADELRVLGIDVDVHFVGRIFRNWRWSWKKPTVQHIHKYSPENITYYAQWISLITLIPFDRLKFCDESHFVSRHLHRRLVVGPTNTQSYLHNSADLADSFSLTLLLDLSNPQHPFFIDLRANSNTEYNFLTFVCAAINDGYLKGGDYLIADNASVHFGADTRGHLLALLAQHGITYLFLPTYSPELNPCELVFAFVKHFIRDHRTPNDQVHRLLLAALANLPFSHLTNFYNCCVNIIERIAD